MRDMYLSKMMSFYNILIMTLPLIAHYYYGFFDFETMIQIALYLFVVVLLLSTNNKFEYAYINPEEFKFTIEGYNSKG
jgi:hypothetical protein